MRPKKTACPLQSAIATVTRRRASAFLHFCCHEEPTNRPENVKCSSENDLLGEDQSQATATPHSEDVQLVQDRPKASETLQVKWKFPIEFPSNDSNDDAKYRSNNSQENFRFQDSKNEQTNYLNHRVDVIRTKLLKKNFFLTRERKTEESQQKNN